MRINEGIWPEEQKPEQLWRKADDPLRERKGRNLMESGRGICKGRNERRGRVRLGCNGNKKVNYGKKIKSFFKTQM